MVIYSLDSPLRDYGVFKLNRGTILDNTLIYKYFKI